MPLKLFDNILKLQGYDIDLARATYLHTDGSRRYARTMAKQIADHHLKHNNFYRSRVTGYNKWLDLPILEKKDFQVPLNSRLSNGYSTKNCYLGSTSGSSGEPFIFAKDKPAHAFTWAAFFECYAIHQIDLKKDLQARFYGLPHSGIIRYKELLKDYLSNRKRFDLFDLSDLAIDHIIQSISHNKYVYLNGYASVLSKIAAYCIEQQLVLKEYCPSLTNCITTSELLLATDRDIIEKGLGVPVINEYGASEVGLIAIENQHQELVINEKGLFVEILDPDGQPVPEGTIGRIVITDLYNKAHPFIRYDIGDLGAIAYRNGTSSILTQLQGRKGEMIALPNGKTAPSLSLYFVTKKAMNVHDNLITFVIIQERLNHFTILYKSASDMSPVQEKHISKAIENYLISGLQIDFKRVESLPQTNSGKRSQFICRL